MASQADLNETILLENHEYDANSFILDIDGFGGPLHLLLALAKDQKVDLTRISILKLADQYLEFISKSKREHIELAADYLVMAAWLAYLKSRLLLPKKVQTDEASPEVLSSHLAWRLKRLEAMRTKAEEIFHLPQTGLDVFTYGGLEEPAIESLPIYEADLIDLLRAYGRQRNKVKAKVHKVAAWPVYSLEEARKTLREKVPKDKNWHDLAKFAPPKDKFDQKPPTKASCYASLLSAGLEMVKQGNLDIKQLQFYDNVFLRSNNRANANDIAQSSVKV